VGRRDRFFNGVTFDETFVNAYGEVDVTGDFFASLFLRKADDIDFVNTQAGDVVQIEPAVRFDLGRHLRTRLSHVYQKFDVEGGNLFTANLTQLNTVYQWNVRTFVRAIIQYTHLVQTPELYTALDPEDVNPQSERLFTQFLFAYKLNPQTVFYERIDLTRSDRTLFLKLGYAWLP
jgi:hypothetical protein